MTYALKHTIKNRFFESNSKKLPPTSSSIHIHIKRAFLQCYLWLHASFVESIEINPEDYEYQLTKDYMLVPIITSKDVITTKNICPCHVKLISCCKFCKCESSSSCSYTFD